MRYDASPRSDSIFVTAEDGTMLHALLCGVIINSAIKYQQILFTNEKGNDILEE